MDLAYNQKLISIIIPAYNAENTIEKCIKSIHNDNVEIIVVIDGATDKTELICKKMQESMSNLKVIVQENKGQFIARINGIKESTGEYIMFLDADDEYFDNTIIEIKKLIEKYDNPDLIRFRYEKPGEYEQYKYFHEDEVKLQKGDFKEKVYPMFLKSYMLNALLTNCVKRDVLINIKFATEDLRYGEDLAINLKIFSEIKNAIFSNQILYKYITTKGSVTKNSSVNTWLKNLEDAIKVYSSLNKYLIKWNMQTQENVEIVNERVVKESNIIIRKIKDLI